LGEDVLKFWWKFEKEIYLRKKRKDFDEIFITQFVPGHLENYDGLNRSTIFRAYPNPITVPVAPVLYLSTEEIKNVTDFVNKHQIQDKYIMLFECSPQSDQSFIDINFALEVSKKITKLFNDVYIILSSNISISQLDDHILDGSVISFRENAELIKYCSLLIGCSSGITWLSTSTWSKKIPTIQLLKAKPFWFASVTYDHNCWGLSTEHIIEMTECSTEIVSNCVKTIIESGFSIAKSKYNQQLSPNLNYYGYILRDFLLRFQIDKAIKFIKINTNKYGKYRLIKWHLLKLVLFLPFLPWRIYKKLKCS
jgi:hypothetical protein